jgi:hypothetical protein
MRRIFTSTVFVAAFAVISFNSFGQCTSPATFTVASTNDFATGMQGFTSTDFSASGGNITSTNVGAGTSKVVTTNTFFQPATQTTVAWGFDLSGAANVTSYTVQARYFDGTSIQTVSVCSGITLANGSRTFSASAPAQILGKNFQLRISFTVSGGNGNTMSLDNFTSNVGAVNAPLPVKFSTLDARVANSSVSLKWMVATEENLAGYEIEKGADGRNFSKIGFVNASGESTYSFVDTKPSSITYYRIKSVDINGRYGYSSIALVKAGKAMIVIKAFPTPFIKNISIQHPTADAGSIITISSADGRVVKSVVPAIGMQQTDIDLSSANAGLYLVHYKNGNGEVETLKILKQ